MVTRIAKARGGGGLNACHLNRIRQTGTLTGLSSSWCPAAAAAARATGRVADLRHPRGTHVRFLSSISVNPPPAKLGEHVDVRHRPDLHDATIDSYWCVVPADPARHHRRPVPAGGRRIRSWSNTGAAAGRNAFELARPPADCQVHLRCRRSCADVSSLQFQILL